MWGPTSCGLMRPRSFRGRRADCVAAPAADVDGDVAGAGTAADHDTGSSTRPEPPAGALWITSDRGRSALVVRRALRGRRCLRQHLALGGLVLLLVRRR